MDQYERAVLDIGTGDGRFIYEKALESPNNLYIGIDPAEKQFSKYQRKINRKKLENALLLVGSIENLPENLPLFDEIYITLPWGSLLGHLILPDKEFIEKISVMLKNKGSLQIVFGYDPDIEQNQAERLDLPELNDDYVRDTIIKKFTDTPYFSLREFKTLRLKDLKKLPSTWGKKLAFGNKRDFYKVLLAKV